MVDVLVASARNAPPAGLEYLPWPYTVYTSDAPGWAACSNALLDAAAARGNDVLFVDDDVTFCAGGLDGITQHEDAAEVFGVTLYDADNSDALQSAGYAAANDGAIWPLSWVVADASDKPWYVAHVTTSLIYLKASVVRAGVRFPVWPGLHHEDVAFTYACWLAGFRVAYVPGRALHPSGIGATKRHTPDKAAKLAENAKLLREWVAEMGIPGAVADGRIPRGAWPLEV